jgi:D-methionine transport system substrate-binding protein
MKRVLGVLVAVAVLFTVLTCNKKEAVKVEDDYVVKSTEKKEKIIIATSSVSIDLAESGKDELAKMGYAVEIIVFDDYVLPNSALVEGSVDANFYQHEPYLNNYNDSNHTDIVMLSPKLYNYYSGLYSVKAATVQDLPNGGRVGIAEDASNISEQLVQLQETGIIKLRTQPSSGNFFTVADIVENSHGYEFTSGDHNKYRNMDEYACLIGTSNTMAEAGVDPTRNLLRKFFNKDLALGMCVMKKDQDAKWVQDIMEAYMSANARASVPASSGFEAAE